MFWLGQWHVALLGPSMFRSGSSRSSVSEMDDDKVAIFFIGAVVGVIVGVLASVGALVLFAHSCSIGFRGY